MGVFKHAFTSQIVRSLILLFCLSALVLSCAAANAASEDVILLTSAEDVYALSRLLASNAAQANYIYGGTGHFDRSADLTRFSFPVEIDTADAKLQYLCGANYALTADLTLRFQTTGNYFMGIGSGDHKFSGTFDGKGHTVILAQEGRIALNSNTGTYLSLFPVAKDATIQNLCVEINSDILVTKSSSNMGVGALVGTGTGVAVSGCSVTIRNAVFGADLAEANARRSYIWVGAFAAKLDSSSMTDCDVTLENAQLVAMEQAEAQLTQSELGGFIGRTRGDLCTTIISGCTFCGTDSLITNRITNTGMTAAYIGNAAATTLSGCSTQLNHTAIQSVGKNVNATSMYSVVSTGGMIGFSQPGSNNTDKIGITGNHITGCTFFSNNRVQQDVILSKAENGSELTAGGLVGCAFNNLRIDNSVVDICYGNISAMKTGTADTTSTYGTQAGGIIGRMEHTGEVFQCTVQGRHLNILSQSPNNQCNAGGIAGIDLGPYHKDVTSLNQCHFDGNGTSQICVSITSASEAGQKPVAAGGIVGTGTYRIEGCTAENVSVVCQTPQISNPTYCAPIAGYHITKQGWWSSNKYFSPRSPEMVECSYRNVQTTFAAPPEQPEDIQSIHSVIRAKTLSLSGVIYMKATIAFTDPTETINSTALSQEQILRDGRILFWREKNMPADYNAALIGTEDQCSTLSDTGIYEGIQEYSAYSYGIAAKEYSDTIFYRTYIMIDGQAYYGPVAEYSVVTYCTNQLRKTSETAVKMKPLLAALLNYGSAAQTFFQYKVDSPANSCLQTFVDSGLLDLCYVNPEWSDDLLTDTSTPANSMSVHFQQSAAECTARTLILDGAVHVKMIFAYQPVNGKGSRLPSNTDVAYYFWTESKFSELEAADRPLTTNNASYVLTGDSITETFSSKYGYEYSATSEGIIAKHLGETLYVAAIFTAADGTESCSGIVTYSPEVYAKSQLSKSSTSANLKQLLKMMVLYGEAAADYFTA